MVMLFSRELCCAHRPPRWHHHFEIVALWMQVKRRLGLLKPDEIPAVPVKYHVVLSKQAFVATIGICYAIISPVTILFALTACGMAYLLQARNLLFFNSKRPETHGTFWPSVSNHLFIILVVGQVQGRTERVARTVVR